MSRPAERTQSERSAQTIAKLVDATIRTIAEIGYHQTSLSEICTRAQVSRGGLFRHFDSRLDLVVAAAEEVADRHLSQSRDQLAGALGTGEELLALVRGRVRDPINAVWLELLVAARTDEALRSRLAPVAVSLLGSIEQLAADTVPGVDPELSQVLVTSLLHLLDGEAVFSFTYPRPALEAQRLRLLAGLLDHLLEVRSPHAGGGGDRT